MNGNGPNNMRRRALAVGGVLALLGLGAVVIFLKGGDERANGGITLPPVATTTGHMPPASESGGVSAAPSYQGEPVGVLHADQEFLKQVPKARYEQSLAELRELSEKLASESGQPELWLRVAFIKHYYGDEIGTRDAYEYLNLIAPSDPIPFYNLAVLYGYNLKEPVKAIPKYRAAIRLNPLNASFYVGFADFYRQVASDLPLARQTLLEGLAKLPGDPNLLIALAALANSMGDRAGAIAYYEQALEVANLGSTERAAITGELERLKRSP